MESSVSARRPERAPRSSDLCVENIRHTVDSILWWSPFCAALLFVTSLKISGLRLPASLASPMQIDGSSAVDGEKPDRQKAGRTRG